MDRGLNASVLARWGYLFGAIDESCQKLVNCAMGKDSTPGTSVNVVSPPYLGPIRGRGPGDRLGDKDFGRGD